MQKKYLHKIEVHHLSQNFRSPSFQHSLTYKFEQIARFNVTSTKDRSQLAHQDLPQPLTLSKCCTIIFYSSADCCCHMATLGANGLICTAVKKTD